MFPHQGRMKGEMGKWFHSFQGDDWRNGEGEGMGKRGHMVTDTKKRKRFKSRKKNEIEFTEKQIEELAERLNTEPIIKNSK